MRAREKKTSRTEVDESVAESCRHKYMYIRVCKEWQRVANPCHIFTYQSANINDILKDTYV